MLPYSRNATVWFSSCSLRTAESEALARSLPARALSADMDGTPAPPSVLPTTPEDFAAAARAAEQTVPPLEVQIGGWRKSGSGLNSFTAYLTSWRTSLPSYPRLSGSVERRFSDFAWLHSALIKEWSGTGVVVPPLPNGKSNIFYRFDHGVVDARRVALETFLRRCAAHPLVRESRALVAFLLEPNLRQVQDEFDVRAAARPGQPLTAVKPSWKNRLSPGSRGLLHRDTPAPVHLSRAHPGVQWAALVAYLDAFEDRCLALRAAAADHAARTLAAGNALETFGRAAVALGESECVAFGLDPHHLDLDAATFDSPDPRAKVAAAPSRAVMRELVRSTARDDSCARDSCALAEGVLGGAFLELGANAEALGRAVSRTSEGARSNLERNLKEAVRYARAVRSAIESLDAAAGRIDDLDRKTSKSLLAAETLRAKAEAEAETVAAAATISSASSASASKSDAVASPGIGSSTAAGGSPGVGSCVRPSGVDGDENRSPTRAERATAAAEALATEADEARSRLEAARTRLELEVVHWHQRVSAELGACLRGFVAAEARVAQSQADTWTRVLGPGWNHRPPATA